MRGTSPPREAGSAGLRRCVVHSTPSRRSCARRCSAGCSTQNVIFVPNRSFEVYCARNIDLRRNRGAHARAVLRKSRSAQGRRTREARQSIRAPASRRHQSSAPVCLARGDRSPRYGEGAARARELRARVLLGVVTAGVSRNEPATHRRGNARRAEGFAARAIEEFALGPSVNFNFFYSPLLGELELSGTDTRRQTNLEGFRNVPPSALEAVRDVPMRLEEAGHIAATMLESMLEPAFAMGERFVQQPARRARRVSSVRSHCNASSRRDRRKSSSATTCRCESRAHRGRAIRRTRPIAGVATSRWANASPWKSSWRATPIGSKMC